jgi:UDP-galactopyranose mutase
MACTLRYKTLADQEKNVIFGGRLAEYKYYDMAPIVDKVLQYVRPKMKNKRAGCRHHR